MGNWIPRDIARNAVFPVGQLFIRCLRICLFLEGEPGWAAMRTVADLRRALGVGAPRDRDSLYAPIQRPPRQFNPLRIPRKLQVPPPASFLALRSQSFDISVAYLAMRRSLV